MSKDADTKHTQESFLRLPQVLALIPVSRSTFLAGVRSGKYPKPARLSVRCVAWKRSDVDALIQQIVSQQAA
jgi:predicted DNA-binding transcriptional regulator AlpA